MRKIRRFLTGVISAALIMSSLSVGTLANEINIETETAYEEVTSVMETESVQHTSEEEREPVSETVTDIGEESSETTETETTETETAAEIVAETAVVAGEGAEIIQNFECHVADAFSFEYTDEDIREAIESEFSTEDLFSNPEELTLEESFSNSTEIVEYLRTQMKGRVTNFTFETPSAIDYAGCLAKAYEEDSNNDPKAGDYIRANFIGYYISWSYGGGRPYTYTFTLKYTSDASQERQVDQKVANIVNRLDLKSTTKSQHDKIQDIHDYLINNIRYYNDGAYYCHGTAAALLSGYCVCQGYAATFHRLCREAGINDRYVVGDSINHAWNVVRVNDNGKDEWYNMDVTWDDPLPDGQYRTTYFMKNDVEFTGHPRNSEFRTKAFEKAHPMAMYSWGKTTTGVNEANPSYIFTDINGEKLSSHVDTELGIPKLLIFYSNTCANSKNAISTISASLPVKYGRVEVYALEVTKGTESSIREFASKYDPANNIKFISNGLNAAYKYRELAGESGTTLPYVAMIDEHDTLRFVTTGAILGDDINTIFMRYLVEGWNPYATPLKSISLDKTNIRLGRSRDRVDSEQLNVTYNPDDCINLKKATFVSSDEDVVTVSANGIVTPVGAGQATITATCAGLKATCKVTVVSYVDDIIIKNNKDENVSSKTLAVHSGEDIELNLITNPTNATVVGGIRWTSSDPNLVSIDKREEGYTVVAKISPDITESKTVTIKAEVDGKSSYCKFSISPSLVKLNANGGQINGKSYDYYKVIPGTPFGELPNPDTRNGYAFVGWKTSSAQNSGDYVSSNTVVNGQWEIYAIWKKVATEQMWARELGNYSFTGAAIKPVVKVYDGNILLTEGVDYTVSYKNNKSVYQYKEDDTEFLAAKAPCAVIRGKKNYTDSFSIYFTISPKSVSDSDISVSTDLLVKSETAKAQYLVPVIKWGKVLLKNKTDFTVEYPDNTKDSAYKNPGLYRITVRGNGNYCGERTVNMRITDKNAVSIKKAVVKNLINYEFTGSEIKQNTAGDKPFALYYAGKPLVEGTDYYMEYFNNRDVGTATINVTGIGNFTGVKKLNFKINGRNIAKATINSDALLAVSYTGQTITPAVNLTYKLDKYTTITLNQSTDGKTGDYIVKYSNNTEPGNGQVTITGINEYYGTLNKKFRITSYKFAGADDSRIKITYDKEVAYSKSGAKPAVTVSYLTMKSNGSSEWVTLTEGTDYTLKYANNTKVFIYGPEDEGFYEKNGKTKSPVVTIVGKKRFAGSISEYYKIKPGSLKNQASIAVADVMFSDKPGKWMVKPVVTDMAGKRLAPKTDYVQDVVYTYAKTATMVDGSTRAAGTAAVKEDVPVAGTEINVTITGAGNYSSNVLDNAVTLRPYKIIAANKDIGKGITFTVSDKYYNGSGMNPDTGIVITKADITYKPDKNHMDFTDSDYEIVPGSYTKNRFTGVATVTLRGIKGYGGIKTVKFKIKAKQIF